MGSHPGRVRRCRGRLDPDTQEVVAFTDEDGVLTPVSDLALDADGAVWTAGNGDASRHADSSWRAFLLRDQQWAVAPVDGTTVWVGGRGGLGRLELAAMR